MQIRINRHQNVDLYRSRYVFWTVCNLNCWVQKCSPDLLVGRSRSPLVGWSRRLTVSISYLRHPISAAQQLPIPMHSTTAYYSACQQAIIKVWSYPGSHPIIVLECAFAVMLATSCSVWDVVTRKFQSSYWCTTYIFLSVLYFWLDHGSVLIDSPKFPLACSPAPFNAITINEFTDGWIHQSHSQNGHVEIK